MNSLFSLASFSISPDLRGLSCRAGLGQGAQAGPPARRGGARHAGIKAGGWWRRVRPSYCGEVDYAFVLREAHGELPIRDEDMQRYWDEDKITVRYSGEA